jgi:hypothetical protein
MTQTRLVILSLVLILLAAWPASADNETPAFKEETARIQVLDNFRRPYVVPAETAWLGVRLARNSDQTPSVKPYQSLATQGLEYPVEGDANAWSNVFPLVDGHADVKFVVFEDAAKHEVGIFKSLWQAGNGAEHGNMNFGVRRPELTPEKVAIGSFIFVSLIIGYLLFGRELFRRMLFNKRMEVASAVTWSNILVLIFLMLAVVVAVGMYVYPIILWDSLYNIYIVSILGYLAVLLVSYGVATAMTRR